ncbi:MAG: Rho termination factor N-terminal domain-containing protein [Caldisericum exile]|uniref:Rho termination factor N-terminal domain-containing protein n=1 Tax=Caldisericum exile TaxID=693075 RepID=UPI003C755056
MENLNKLKRKELLKLAKLHGIKNRNKMKKEELIKAIKKAKKPLEELKAIEEKLRKELQEKTGETHLIIIPKEPGYAFVNWEVKEESGTGILKVFEDKHEKFEIQVNIEHGKSYVRVEEDKKIKAVLGIEKNGKFAKIIESNEIIIPTTKRTEGKAEFVDIRTLKKAKPQKVEKDKMKEVINEEIKTAREIKYLRYKREGQ